MYLRSGNFWLFLILGLNFWLVPLVPSGSLDEPLADALITFTLLSAVAIQGFSAKRYRVAALIACLVILAASAVEEVFPNTAYIENGVFAVSFVAVTALYFHTMLDSLERASFDTVLAAACTFILIGMFFAAVFGLVVEFSPDAFASQGETLTRFDLLFYSFATLTTLGAQDILPVSDLAKMLTVFEAIAGLIYIAILVGALVGSYAAKVSVR